MDLIDPKTIALRRAQIDRLKAESAHLPQRELTLKHYFVDGLYVREIFMPAGTGATGRVHLFDHINFVLGDVTEFTPFVERRLTGYHTFTAPAGTSRALAVHADTWWTTVHANPDNVTDLDTIFDRYTVDTFERFDAVLPYLKQQALA